MTVDWERIESDYRAGILSLREISLAHGISHQGIAKKAKAKKWERDLSAKIKAKADLLVAKATGDKEGDRERRLSTDQATVDANAQQIANIRLSHRGDISRFRALAIRLLEELEAETSDPELFQRLGLMLRDEDDKGVDKLNDIYMKVISSAGRVDSTKKLAETLKILIGLEREAYSIAETPTGGNEMEGLAARLEKARARIG